VVVNKPMSPASDLNVDMEIMLEERGGQSSTSAPTGPRSSQEGRGGYSDESEMMQFKCNVLRRSSAAQRIASIAEG
jgi:hypothetical protein